LVVAGFACSSRFCFLLVGAVVADLGAVVADLGAVAVACVVCCCCPLVLLLLALALALAFAVVVPQFLLFSVPGAAPVADLFFAAVRLLLFVLLFINVVR
jgi:hypothetical protein